MNASRRLPPLLLPLLLLLPFPAYGQAEPAPPPKQQYVIVLKLPPRLLDAAHWTEADNQAVAAHFERLKGLTEAGTVILAGRTLNDDADQFGLIILEAESEAAARAVMDDDPAVKAGVMTARLFPYRVALMRSAAGGS